MNSRELLESLRDNLGDPPRQIGFFTRLTLRVSPPKWMRDDPLREIFRQQTNILREGDVVWSSLVQANNLLFEPGPNDHPAMVVYSLDASFEDRIDLLQQIGLRLSALKGTNPTDPEERRLAQSITNEMDRNIGWTVPKALTWGREVKCSTLMIFRRHLPLPYLQNGWFPLLVDPDTELLMVVPARFWPRELVKAWSG